ncbi:hypothetical protein GEMRC1_007930 [Eukaryota sp. GEM-RC1]
MQESICDTASRITGFSASKSDDSKVTDSFGHVLPSVTHHLNVGNMPLAIDGTLFEKQMSFNRGKTVERIVHPCGAGVFGYFEASKSCKDLTKACIFSDAGKRTPVFVRFSTTTYGKEYPDSARNVRGFAIKFYTEDGNMDLLGLNWPVFFTRDPMKGPDVIRSQQRNPKTFCLNYEELFKYAAENPESLHAITMHFSDRGTPVGFARMDGFGVHTFKWVNETGNAVYIKYHWLCQQQKQDFTDEDAEKMCGTDPDFAKRNLFEQVENGSELKWKFSVQIMTIDQSQTVDFDPFDCTKVWPHAEFPLTEIGTLVLNRNPENYHRDVEQSAFSPGNLIPGIEPSPDPLLQWRVMFYRDAQYHRLGVNHHQIPVNCPFMAKHVNPQSRDGELRVDDNGSSKSAIISSQENRSKVDQKADFQQVAIPNAKVSREAGSRHEGTSSEFDQVRELFERVLQGKAKENLLRNTAKYLQRCSEETQQKYLSQLGNISQEYKDGVVRCFVQV